MTIPTIIFAGGGTGGHIVPAIAITEALQALGPVRTVHVGSDRPLDGQIHETARRAGVIDHALQIPARPFSVRPAPLARLIGSWGVCVRTVRAVIREERARGRPVAMVAMGGFVAAPAAQAARAERCPMALVNFDAVPGLANRWIARRASTRFAVARAPARPAGASWTTVRPIVRAAFASLPTPGEARARFGLDADRPTLLVTGGSQGARSINAFLGAMVEAHADRFRSSGWQVIHQSGPGEAEAVAAMYQAACVRAHVAPFFDDMAAAWAASDAAVARAGAGTVAEVWATGTPTLFLPYPYHADEHQKHNAAPLEPGVVIGQDQIDADANARRNGETLLLLLGDEAARGRMRSALEALGPADGADTIARGVLSELRPRAGQ